MLRKTHCSPYGGWRGGHWTLVIVTRHHRAEGGGGKDNFIVTNKPEVK